MKLAIQSSFLRYPTINCQSAGAGKQQFSRRFECTSVEELLDKLNAEDYGSASSSGTTRGGKRGSIARPLMMTCSPVANDEPLEPCYRDHALTGDWHDRRDCHIRRT